VLALVGDGDFPVEVLLRLFDSLPFAMSLEEAPHEWHRPFNFALLLWISWGQAFDDEAVVRREHLEGRIEKRLVLVGLQRETFWIVGRHACGHPSEFQEHFLDRRHRHVHGVRPNEFHRHQSAESEDAHEGPNHLLLARIRALDGAKEPPVEQQGLAGPVHDFRYDPFSFHGRTEAMPVEKPVKTRSSDLRLGRDLLIKSDFVPSGCEPLGHPGHVRQQLLFGVRWLRGGAKVFLKEGLRKRGQRHASIEIARVFGELFDSDDAPEADPQLFHECTLRFLGQQPFNDFAINHVSLGHFRELHARALLAL
jgi:hypothetical protein